MTKLRALTEAEIDTIVREVRRLLMSYGATCNTSALGQINCPTAVLILHNVPRPVDTILTLRDFVRHAILSTGYASPAPGGAEKIVVDIRKDADGPSVN